jgi:hypothetical protein
LIPRPASDGEDGDQQVWCFPASADRLGLRPVLHPPSIRLPSDHSYFVPDENVMSACSWPGSVAWTSARSCRNPTIWSIFVFLLPRKRAGRGENYRYQPVSYHKVLLVDNRMAAGTANLITAPSANWRSRWWSMIAALPARLRRCPARPRPLHASRSDDRARRSFLFRIAVRVARLMAPIQ